MDSREHFELKRSTGIGYDFSLGKHITRISNRSTQTLTRLIIEEKKDEDFGKFIKPTTISQLSFTELNPQNKRIEIITFNIPAKKMAYKAIYNPFEELPRKIFYSLEEGKWIVTPNPSKELLDKCASERALLMRSIYPPETETNLVFYR